MFVFPAKVSLVGRRCIMENEAFINYGMLVALFMHLVLALFTLCCTLKVLLLLLKKSFVEAIVLAIVGGMCVYLHTWLGTFTGIEVIEVLQIVMGLCLVFIYLILPLVSTCCVLVFGLLFSERSFGKAILLAIAGLLCLCLWTFFAGPANTPLGIIAIVVYILVVIAIMVVNLLSLNKTPNSG